MILYYSETHGRESIEVIHPTFGDCAGIQYDAQHTGKDHHGNVTVHSRGFRAFIYAGF